MCSEQPIIRWTIGNVCPNGYTLLKYSVSSFIQHYGNNYRFIICYNNITKEKLNVNNNVELYQQNYKVFQGSGSVWKLTPPRLNISVPELFIDNDVVFTRKNLKIVEFLQGQNFLLCKENFKAYGKYTEKMSEIEKYNAGLFGIPENYEFEKELIENWKKLGSIPHLGSLEEQGLVAYTISKHEHISIEPKEFFLCYNSRPKTEKTKYNWSADTHHFVGANRNKFNSYFREFNIKHL